MQGKWLDLNVLAAYAHQVQAALCKLEGAAVTADAARACKSICGFQSLSNSTTMSAVARLMPRPPARVDSRKMNLGDPSRLNSSIAYSRSSPPVLPSMRQ
jgi:hypothetical protein